MKISTIFSIIIVLLIAVGIWQIAKSAPPATSGSNAEDIAVRAVVTEFGTKLQMVSLLASSADRKSAMDTAYAMYVAPELLQAWYPEGSDALGRYASSPWPSSISIASVQFEDDDTAVVEGNVIEVAQATASSTAPVAVYPVTLALEQRSGQWLITKADKGAYSEIPHSQTITGNWECLPHKDAIGPQTLECAFGISADQSDGRSAIDTSLMSAYPSDFPTGTKVRVTGVVTPADQLSSVQKYDIDGIIMATVIEKI